MNYLFKRRTQYINIDDVDYWTKKWGVNSQQINSAIIETGSINLHEIKNVLKQKGQVGKIYYWIKKILKIV